MSKVFKSSRVTVDVRPMVIETIDESVKYIETVEDEEVDFSEFDEEEVKATVEEILENARREAEAIIEAANGEAENVLQDARRLAAAEREETKKAGFDEGYQEGQAKIEVEAEEARENANRLIEHAHEIKAQIISKAEPEIMALVEKLVQKLLMDEAMINPKVIAVLVKSGLSQTSLNGEMTVRVSPADYSNLMEYRTEMLAPFEGLADIKFESDQAIREHECLIETAFGTVDCGLGLQSKELIKSLNYLLKNR